MLLLRKHAKVVGAILLMYSCAPAVVFSADLMGHSDNKHLPVLTGLDSSFKAVTNSRPSSELNFSDRAFVIQATEPGVEDEFVAVVKTHSLEELQQLLSKMQDFADDESDTSSSYQSSYGSVPLVLHGEEIEFFQRKNYSKYRQVIDLAAQLVAFDIIDVRVCETWMRRNGVKRSELPPFIKTVPNGPGEVKRLKAIGAVDF